MSELKSPFEDARAGLGWLKKLAEIQSLSDRRADFECMAAAIEKLITEAESLERHRELTYRGD